jgi:CRP-like cAMP-binding protein
MLNEAQGSPSRTDSHGRSVHNDLLTRIPENEYRIVRPLLEYVPLQTQQVLQEAGENIEHLVLLSSGLVSLLVVTSDARSVEVGMVGKDGCVGGALVAGVRIASQRALVQIPGEAFRIKADAFIQILDQCPELLAMLHRYILLQCMQVGQLAACNRLHEVDERLARWLLMSHDRADGNVFPITHDQLARMLGSGRPSVTVAAGGLQRAGVIQYKRGQVKVINREGLEHAACECYDAMRRIHPVNPGSPELSA